MGKLFPGGEGVAMELLPLPEGKPCGGFPAKTQAKLCRDCSVLNKNYCCLCLGVVAARTNAMLCKECAERKNDCMLCGQRFETLDVGAHPAALCRSHAVSWHSKCAKIRPVNK